jgi:hypothetical protein
MSERGKLNFLETNLTNIDTADNFMSKEFCMPKLNILCVINPEYTLSKN